MRSRRIKKRRAAESGAALSLNFLSGLLDSRISFTRGTNATFVGSNGLIQSSVINTPRFDYDPVTLAPKGLLIEEQRTNLFFNSLTDGTSLSTQSITVTATPYTISFYGTGSITLSGAATATISGTGAYPTRTTLTFTPTAGTLTCTVSGSVQYANCEAGAFATSYIPTVASTATRSADVATMTGTNFSSWFNATEGTFVSSGDVIGYSNNAMILSATDGSTTDLIQQFLVTSALARFVSRISNVDQAILDKSVSLPGAYKMASAYMTDNFASTVNGDTVVTDITGGIPTVNRLGIGSRNGLLQLNGHIRSITYYNTRLPNTTLQDLTT
jgi:hypothetical protein